MAKKTLILGASTKPSRYAYIATERLVNQGVDVVLLGSRGGQVLGLPIQIGTPSFEDIHTVTLYINPLRQTDYYDYLLRLQPQRIIFNPGTENPELMKLARQQGIDVEIACTLVMLATNQY